MQQTEQPTPVSAETLAAFKARRDDIIDSVVAMALTRQEEVVQHGEDAEHIITRGLEFTMNSLQAAMELNRQELLIHELEWALQRLPHDEVMPRHLLSRLQMLAQAVTLILPAEHAGVVREYVEGMVRWLSVRLVPVEQGGPSQPS